MINILNTLVVLFAQDAPAPQGGRNPLMDMLPLMLIAAAFCYFILYLPSKRERARQGALWNGIKKNDRVRTTSGIYGVVTNVSKESNPPEVTLRIDETTNTKLRVTLSSIAQVLGDEPTADTPSK